MRKHISIFAAVFLTLLLFLCWPQQSKLYCMMVSRWNEVEQNKWDAILDTWASSCDVLTIFVPESEAPPGTLQYVNPNGRRVNIVTLALKMPINCNGKPCRNIWEPVRLAWSWVYEHDSLACDWYIKVDSDTFLWGKNLIAETKRQGWDSAEPFYFGKLLRHIPGNPFVAGSSYVMSAGALARFAKSIDTPSCTQIEQPVEDVQMAVCLRSLGIEGFNGFDEHGKEKFLPFDIDYSLALQKGDWWFFVDNPQTQFGEDCCSDKPVAFHYVAPNKMRNIARFLRGEEASLSLREKRYLSKVRG